MPKETVVIFTGGDPPRVRTAKLLPSEAYVIAADSGLEHAMSVGRSVDLVVGDMDSVRPLVLESAIRAGVMAERHPAAKDQTDIELALDRALDMGASRVDVVGGSGDRLDHFLANVLLLASPRYEAMNVRAFMGSACVDVVRESLEFQGNRGDLVTLLPVSGVVEGATTGGLLYRLEGDTLMFGSTRGVSNKMSEPTAWVSVGSGVLAVVRPFVNESHSR